MLICVNGVKSDYPSSYGKEGRKLLPVTNSILATKYPGVTFTFFSVSHTAVGVGEL